MHWVGQCQHGSMPIMVFMVGLRSFQYSPFQWRLQAALVNTESDPFTTIRSQGDSAYL